MCISENFYSRSLSFGLTPSRQRGVFPCKVTASGKNVKGRVNHHIELTEEEKAQQRKLALKRFQEEELRKLQTRNSKAKATKPQETKQPELSLFDDF